MEYAGYLKNLAQVDGPDGLYYKAVIHIRKDKTTVESRTYLDSLMGKTVSVTLEESYDEDYETAEERRERKEREKYEGVMGEKRRREAESRELPLDETKAPEPIALTLPPVDIPIQHEAEPAIRFMAVDGEGTHYFAEVGADGLCTAYRKESGCAPAIFGSVEANMDAEAVCAGLREFATSNSLTVEQDDFAVTEEPVAKAMVYRDADGKSYYVSEKIEGDEPGWYILESNGHEEAEYNGPYESQATAEGKMAEHADANGWQPVNVTELLAEAKSEEKPPIEMVDGGAAEEATGEQPEQTLAELAREESENIAQVHEDPKPEPEPESEPEQPAEEPAEPAGQPTEESEPQAEGGLFGQIIENWDTPDAITYVIKAGAPGVRIKIESVNLDERSVKLFGFGTVFADELNEKYSAAPREEVAEATQEAAEPASEQGAASEASDPFDDEASLKGLYDWLLARKNAGTLRGNGTTTTIKVKAEFLKDGDRKGPITVLDVLPDREGVKLLSRGLVDADTIDEQFEVCK